MMQTKTAKRGTKFLALLLAILMLVSLLPISAMAAETHNYKIIVKSNVWDPSVQVIKSPVAVQGGNSIGLDYTGKLLEITGQKKVTVNGTGCRFSHFLINGKEYTVTASTQSFTDVEGFEGTMMILTDYSRGLQFKADGKLTGNITVEFVYNDVPENTEEAAYTPVVTAGDSNGQVSAAFTANTEAGSIWTVTGKPNNDWYQLGYVEAADGTRYESSDGQTAAITVTEADQTFTAYFTSAVQPMYNETPADEVTINVTISNDGMPLLGRDDETVLSNMDITIPYFDLENYDLGKYHRYGTEYGWGNYSDETLIERPTALHAYIYLLERYYLGLPEEECGTGESDLLGYNKNVNVSYMDGDQAYATNRTYAITPTQNATSLYMKTFWGHDENLMYFVNHQYPLMSKGVGSTCDYILLEDGDRIDVAMFTDWNFYTHGGFNQFDQDAYKLDQGETLTVSTFKAGTSAAEDGNSPELEGISNLNVAVYDETWAHVADLTGEGTYSYTFEEPGTYYLMAVDPNAKTDTACYAPATAEVTVAATPQPDTDGYYLIDSADDMVWLQKTVNIKNNTAIKVAMTDDIDMSGIEWSELKNFSGEFDGRGHSLNVNLTSTNLFRDLTGTIKNLTVTGTISTKTDRVGGFAYNAQGGAVFENCINRADITTKHGSGIAGGIVGCVNQGIDKSVIIRNCYNYGSITGKQQVGGIMGADYGYVATQITGCENHGTINGAMAGGILGQSSDNTEISQCLNTGVITGSSYGGGILARTNYYTSLVELSANTGSVSGNYAGGIVAFNYAQIDSCYNTGAISGKAAAGGITGTTQMCRVYNTNDNEVGKVCNCYTTGTVTGTGDVGSAVGQLSGGTVAKRVFQVYALEGTCDKLVGKLVNEDIKDQTEFKTEAELKSADMLSTLGEDFKKDLGKINNGYPVLSWQESEGVEEPDVPVAEGYTVSTSEGSQISVGEQAETAITIANNDETTYNAYDLTVCYDADKLTYTGINVEDATVTDKDGILHIVGYGADKACGTDNLILTFTGKATGEAKVTVTKANIDKSANANTQDAPAATIVDAEAIVSVNGYKVELSDDFNGDGTVEPGADYTFTAKDTHYDYVIDATMGGEEVNVVDNGDGTYTIRNVTGNLVITDTKTAKTYNVTVEGSGAADAVAADKATYLTDYTFRVTQDDKYTYAVSATVAGQSYNLTQNENGTYTIAGADVTGDIVITVVKEKKPVTETQINFVGSGSEDVIGGTTQTAPNGTDFVFEVNKTEGYDYTVTLGGQELTPDEEGKYTIPGNQLTGEAITVTVEKTEQETMKVNAVRYIDLDGKTIWLVTASGTVSEDAVLAYDGNAMFWSDKYEAYCYLVISEQGADAVKADAAGKIAEASAEKVIISYDGDVNETGVVDINDAQLTYDLYNAKYDSFETVSMLKFLEADVNGDATVNVTDAAAIIAQITNG